MPPTPGNADIERVVKMQQEQLQSGGPSTGDSGNQGGTVQKQRMLPPKPKPNMLNEEMAKQAAVKYKKDQKRIQKAIAKVDGSVPAPEESKCCCTIL